MRKKALRPPTKTAVVCLDGPLARQTLWLTLGATAVAFSIKGQTGFYCGGRWNVIS